MWILPNGEISPLVNKDNELLPVMQIQPGILPELMFSQAGLFFLQRSIFRSNNES